MIDSTRVFVAIVTGIVFMTMFGCCAYMEAKCVQAGKDWTGDKCTTPEHQK